MAKIVLTFTDTDDGLFKIDFQFDPVLEENKEMTAAQEAAVDTLEFLSNEYELEDDDEEPHICDDCRDNNQPN